MTRVSNDRVKPGAILSLRAPLVKFGAVADALQLRLTV